MRKLKLICGAVILAIAGLALLIQYDRPPADVDCIISYAQGRMVIIRPIGEE